MEKTSFFTKDKSFYKSLFSMLLIVALQNLVAYSVNIADNIMLGSYSQTALSGAATVNQIFFMVQQIAIATGESLVMIGSQYWGKKDSKPISKLTGIALKWAFISGIIIILISTLFPSKLLGIFTAEADIISEGMQYLSIIQYSFVIYVITNVFISALRSVETVKISFIISVISLVINVAINYTLIFGNFGAPQLGIKGAAIGTLIARIVELFCVLFFVLKIEKKIKIIQKGMFSVDKVLFEDYRKVVIPMLFMQLVWAVSVPLQTAILGHISADAIAANSVATTFYQYMKVIVQAMSSVAAVLIGTAIGKGDIEEVKRCGRTLSCFCLALGFILGFVLFSTRGFLLSFYSLNDNAMLLADQFISVMSLVMCGMSYQMSVTTGVIRGGGDTKFPFWMNLICTWGIVMPFSFLSAFYWKLPVALTVLMIQSDQLFKGIPVLIRFRSYKWIKKLTH